MKYGLIYLYIMINIVVTSTLDPNGIMILTQSDETCELTQINDRS